MNISEIKAAVDSGKTVHWSNTGYEVVKDHPNTYLIKFNRTGSCIGLTNRSGDKLNGLEVDFFIPHSIKHLPHGATVIEQTCEDGFKWLVIEGLQQANGLELWAFHESNTVYELFDDGAEGMRDTWADFMETLETGGTIAVEDGK